MAEFNVKANSEYQPKLATGEAFYRGDGGFSPSFTIFDKETGKVKEYRDEHGIPCSKTGKLYPKTDKLCPESPSWIM